MNITELLPAYTIADYLQWEGDWELWSGRPVAMSPSPRKVHSKVGRNFIFEVESQLRNGDRCDNCELFYEVDWHIDDQTVVRPDLAICCGEEDTDGWIKTTPVLISEILSPSTRKIDLTAKKKLYAAQGVRFYLIIDPEDHFIALYLLDDGTYREASLDDPIELEDDCKITVEAGKLFS